MFLVKTLDIIPSYECNLNCMFCLNRPERTSKTHDVLNIDICERTLSLLKKESGELSSITIYGGEVMLLDSQYLRELIMLCRSYYPRAVMGIISNLVEVSGKVIDLVKGYGLYLSTSYDSLRFINKGWAFSSWLKNMEKLRDTVRDVLVIASRYVEEDVNFLLTKFGNNVRIHVYQLFIPENASIEQESFIKKHMLSARDYVRKLSMLTDIFKGVIITHNNDAGYMFNHLHLFPDGRVGLAGPSSRGYPYERVYIFYPSDSGSIVYSHERISYIKSQLSICLPCEYYPRGCYAEFFFPGVCLGKRDLSV